MQRHVFLRRLLALSQRMTPELFVKSVQRAHRYRITSLETIERIAAVAPRRGNGANCLLPKSMKLFASAALTRKAL